MNRSVAVVATLLFAMGTASAQTRQPSSTQEAIDAAYALGIQTGQRITEVLKADDDRLKWVLDNWVPKQIEPAKP